MLLRETVRSALLHRNRVFAGSLFEEIEAVFGCSKTALQNCRLSVGLRRVVLHLARRLDSESIEALEGNGDVDFTLVPDVNSALSLLLIEVFGVVIDEHSRNFAKLTKKSWLSYYVLLSELPRQSDHVQEVRNDHPKLLHLHQICLFARREQELTLIDPCFQSLGR